jgi:hypothetical protein
VDIKVKGPGGQTTQLSQLQVNSAFTPVQVSHDNVSVAGFTAGGDCATCGWGYTGFKAVSFSWLAPSSGEAALVFEVGDVGDGNEQCFNSMLYALDPSMVGAGGFNAGFVRDDALRPRR